MARCKAGSKQSLTKSQRRDAKHARQETYRVQITKIIHAHV